MPYIYQFIVYFGKLPNFFQLYLDSIKLNDILRVIFITDCDFTSYIVPPNVMYFSSTLDEVRIRALRFIKEEFNKEPLTILPIPYKLCDFKVLYHKLFSDIVDLIDISKDDFIGWGDCDLIYGKLTHFMNSDLPYDFIGERGHFTAFRNIEPFISAYKRIDRLYDRLLSQHSQFIDEQSYIDVIFKLCPPSSPRFFYTIHKMCDIIPECADPSKYTDLVATNKQDKPIDHFVFHKTSGTLTATYKSGETSAFMYVHLHKRPMKVTFDNYTDKFVIRKDGFVL